MNSSIAPSLTRVPGMDVVATNNMTTIVEMLITHAASIFGEPETPMIDKTSKDFVQRLLQ